MNSDPNATRPHVPPPALRSYTGPMSGYHQPHSDFLHHPLHRVYRRKIRGVRVLWFGVGMVIGGIMAFALIILLSALVYTRIPKVVQAVTGDPDLTITLTEGYINREVAARIVQGFDLGNPNLTFLGASVEITGENRIDYQANFNVNIPFFSSNITAQIKNQITAQNGALVITMVGDPQIGNLSLPLDALPFNLKGSITQAFDRVNNDIVVAQINKYLQGSLTGTSLALDAVTTDERNLVLLLRQP